MNYKLIIHEEKKEKSKRSINDRINSKTEKKLCIRCFDVIGENEPEDGRIIKKNFKEINQMKK